MASGEMAPPQFTAFIGSAFQNLAVFSVDGSLHYICMDWRHVTELLTAAQNIYGEPKISVSGSRTMAGWARSTAASTSLSSSSNTGAARTATTQRQQIALLAAAGERVI